MEGGIRRVKLQAVNSRPVFIRTWQSQCCHNSATVRPQLTELLAISLQFSSFFFCNWFPLLDLGRQHLVTSFCQQNICFSKELMVLPSIKMSLLNQHSCSFNSITEQSSRNRRWLLREENSCPSGNVTFSPAVEPWPLRIQGIKSAWLWQALSSHYCTAFKRALSFTKVLAGSSSTSHFSLGECLLLFQLIRLKK